MRQRNPLQLQELAVGFPAAPITLRTSEEAKIADFWKGLYIMMIPNYPGLS
jgi:hypothetical protein